MDTVSSKLTVYFDGSFWVGVYERRYGGKLEAAKIVFGAEPKDYEVYDLILHQFHRLRFSPQVKEELSLIPKKSMNPKRLHRSVEKSLRERGVGTKAQQALALQREVKKETTETIRKGKKAERAERQFMLKQEKKKEKRRGR